MVDRMDTEESRLRRLCLLTLFEITHLKKLLISKGVIPEDNIYDYANSLAEYMKELDSKDRLLRKDYPEAC
jgi:hypothetical protein